MVCDSETGGVLMAIFPLVEEEVLNQGTIAERGINFLFDFELNDFVIKDGKFIEVVGDAAVIFWIEKTLKTEYEKSAVYQNTAYGTELKELQGKVFPIEVSKTIAESSIKTALLIHERIKSVNGFTFEQVDDKVTIGFEIELNPISFENEFGVDSEDGFNRISTLDEIKDFIGIKLLTSNRLYFKTNLGTQVYLS